MEKLVVLGLPGCLHCDALKDLLSTERIPYELEDVSGESKLADRLEVFLKTEVYPMVIVQKGSGSIYLYRTANIKDTKEQFLGFGGIKVGCVSTENMVTMIKKYIK